MGKAADGNISVVDVVEVTPPEPSETDHNSEQVEMVEQLEQGQPPAMEGIKKFSPADPKLCEFMEMVKEKYHSHLDEAEIGLTVRSGEWIVAGQHKPGNVRVVGANNKAFIDYDFVIDLNGDLLKKCDTPIKLEKMLDHLLCYCSYNENENTGVKVWKLRKPEIVEFPEILERHGLWSQSLQTLKETFKQLSLFEEPKDQPVNPTEPNEPNIAA